MNTIYAIWVHTKAKIPVYIILDRLDFPHPTNNIHELYNALMMRI